ncbi:hypothetical protein [Photobacterium minamisatsumaniensis]|uniref:hypothetical protein n=1 Tax=Photobacterium minamisatsumaniensis TaxID=2910233 RepID=UPI003D10475B
MQPLFLRTLNTEQDFSDAAALLECEALLPIDSPDIAVGFFDGVKMVAVGHRRRELILGICIAKAYRGQQLLGRLITELLKSAIDAGYDQMFLFSKPENRQFEQLGFSCVANSDKASMFEYGWPDIGYWLEGLQQQFSMSDRNLAVLRLRIADFCPALFSVVEQAAASSEQLLVLAEGELTDTHQYQQLKQACDGLPNCQLIAPSAYVLSADLFPDYFCGIENHALAHSQLAAAVFAERIVPALNVKKVFVIEGMAGESMQEYQHALSNYSVPLHPIAAKALSVRGSE